MRAQHPAFSIAKVSDPTYKYIGGKRPDLFWKKMQTGKSKGYFSEEFKDLVGKMLDLAGSRIDIDGIMNHPWVKSEDVPTYEQIKYEF